MVQAIFNGVTLAESADTILIEGNHYFPPSSLVRDHFEPSVTTTECGWKGTAHYFHLNANGARNVDAAWYYPKPKEKAGEIAGYVAFWKGVTVG